MSIADWIARRPVKRRHVDREIVARGRLSATRMFVGKDPDGNATFVLSDSQGRKRLLLSVDRQGSPKIQFLDAAGKTVREIRPGLAVRWQRQRFASQGEVRLV